MSGDAGVWTAYNNVRASRSEPRESTRALIAYAGPGAGRLALDLGSGAGVETEALVRAGWRVLAIDADPAAAGLTQARLPEELRDHVEVRTAAFDELTDLPPAALVHAAYALPFAGDGFEALWARIRVALEPGGWLGCTLFGVNDGTLGDGDEHGTGVVRHTRAQVVALLEGLEVVRLDEDEYDGGSFSGPQHWHTFDVIARCPRLVEHPADPPGSATTLTP